MYLFLLLNINFSLKKGYIFTWLIAVIKLSHSYELKLLLEFHETQQ